MHVIFVLVFWLHIVGANGNVDSVDIDSIEMGGEVHTPEACAHLDYNDVVKPLPRAAEKIEAGLVPRVVCGIPAPDQQIYSPDDPPSADEQKPHAPESNPGHGQWDHDPSGNL